MAQSHNQSSAKPPLWVLLADEGRARILELREPGADLEPVDELSDADAHADNAELRRDAYGRRAAGGTGLAGNVTESAGADKLDHAAEAFARRVAERLTEAHRQHRFAQLRIAAAPRFLGRLRKQLDAEVRGTVIDELAKDLLQLDKRELTGRLFPPAGQPGG